MSTITKPTAKDAEPIVALFERLEKEGALRNPDWVFPLRQAGLAKFAALGFPTTHDEDWRFTNVAPIAKLPFKPVLQFHRHGLDAAAIEKFAFPNLGGSRLVFVDGHFALELSTLKPETGVKVTNLAAALSTDFALLEKHLGRHASTESNAFTALNTAFFGDGAFIHLAANVTASPIHLLFLSSGRENGLAAHPRNLIIAERGAQGVIVESHASLDSKASITNTVTEAVIGENAHVEHIKYQDESTEAFHIAALQAQIDRNANYLFHSIVTGARLSRTNLNTAFNGEGIECVLNGLYLLTGDQLADHHMVVDHAKPRCNSHEYFNGILDGKSKGVFAGRILVRPDAQKTDAKQTNKNLLLTDTATADTKPQLEIYADDVKCTHGATIGQLNDDSIFYLRARGIGLDKARRMLIHAFAGEIMDRIKCEPARTHLDQVVWDRLEEHSAVAVR
ncbi:MAG: Fe-S cluster assembly protein SufD [Verrucomicrobiae bacterium]|nr:Fe-S cluster assembly protein SufD [Verrucomicrobiae bacterium]